jgi:CheY-like chemotaxis protein
VSTPRVLLVDDAPDMRMLERAVLSRSGFEVSEASSGEEALTLLASGGLPDAVVLDVQMPEMDGWDTLVAIRANRRRAARRLPVVVCTVQGQPDDSRRAWRLGCDGYLVKPFPIDQLVEVLSEVISRPPDQRATIRSIHLRESDAPS